jgi:pilus assembly protein CpaC
MKSFQTVISSNINSSNCLWRSISAFAVAGAFFVPSIAFAAPTNIELYVGKVHVLNEPNVKRIAIGNGKVASAAVIDSKQVLVLPEQAGQTEIRLWRKNGTEAEYHFTVHAADVTRVLGEVKSLLGEASSVSIKIVGEKIILDGNNVTADEAARVAEVSKRYPQIINLMGKVGLERMVYVDVKIVEFRKNAFKNLGVKWKGDAPGPTFGLVGDFKRSDEFKGDFGDFSAPAGTAIGRRISPFATYFGITTSFLSALNLAQSNGDATILAEPKLTSKSGGSAKFLAGGEVPIPIANALGQSTISFKPYGVRLDISPLISEGGVIATKVAAEISSIDLANAVQGVPAFVSRKAETEVNLRENETLVLSGLVNEDLSKAIDKVPFLGDIPILGHLFKSTEFRRNQTELVIFLTPRFISADSEFNKAKISGTNERVKSNQTTLVE